jgi:hypothetical protein
VSSASITEERRTWARDLLVRAWRRVETLAGIAAVVPERVRDRADNALRDAVAIAEEWGLDPQAIVNEVAEAAAKDRMAARRSR